jgi:hypothetical protein
LRSRWEQQLRKDVMQEEEHGKKLREAALEREIRDGEAWLLEDTHNIEMPKQKNNKILLANRVYFHRTQRLIAVFTKV